MISPGTYLNGNNLCFILIFPGADRGLRLHLNIEQYEYMHGPNPGAGIKLLVHDNQEVPLVRDLGVAIPPGTHAYVGVQITEVIICNNFQHLLMNSMKLVIPLHFIS